MQVTAGASVEAPAESLPGLVAAFRFTDGGMEEVAVDKPIAEQLALDSLQSRRRACQPISQV
jgi:hypothetical protein